MPVFHRSSGTMNQITWSRTLMLVVVFWITFSSITTYRCPNFSYISNKYLDAFYRITLNHTPAYIVDYATLLFGGREKLVRLYRNTDEASSVFTAFTSKNWKFKSNNCLVFINNFMSQ